MNTLLRLFCVALLTGTAVAAIAKESVADAPKRLGPGEGWLALIVDNGIGATSVRIDGPGLSDGIAGELGGGRNLRLLRFPAGTYRWSMVNRPNWWKREYFSLERHPGLEFRIEAGAVNYPGDLVLRSAGPKAALFYRVNRSLETLLQVDLQQPGLRDALPWRQDTGPDPFPAFAAEALAGEKSARLSASALADEKALRKTRVDPAFKSVFLEAFAEAQAEWVEINPAGDRVLFKLRRGELQVLAVKDLDSGRQVELLATYGRFTGLTWGGDRVIYIEHGMAPGTLADIRKDDTLRVLRGSGMQMAHLPDGELDAAQVRYVPFPGDAWLVRGLPQDPRRGVIGRSDSAGQTHFFAIDESSPSFEARQFRVERRLDKELDHDDWSQLVFDRDGALRAAMVYDEQGRGALSVRQRDGGWRTHAPPPVNTVLRPFGFMPDGGDLVALSDQGRMQLELVRLSAQTGAIGETLLGVPGADLGGVIVRPSDGLVLGAHRYRSGEWRAVYRDQSDDPRVQRAQAQFPGKRAVVLDASAKARRSVVLVYSETDRGTYYVLDEAGGRFDKIADAYAPPIRFTAAAAKTVSIRAADDRALDGLVSLPAGTAPRVPVVVIPAGGAFAAEAAPDYDATVQMLVHGGHAVVRLRYGGSGEARWDAQGVADIEKLLDAAALKFPLDLQRVAVLGSGQGGHTALMALIRAPQRFRCGIAVAPVTDLPLMFSSSDWIRKPHVVDAMRRQAGDPVNGLAALQQNSPVYRYGDLKQPLLLIHGTHDTAVSFEHSLRLRTMLASAGRPPRWLPLRRGDQSLSQEKDRLAIQVTSDAFLRECLRPDAATSTSARP